MSGCGERQTGVRNGFWPQAAPNIEERTGDTRADVGDATEQGHTHMDPSRQVGPRVGIRACR